MQEHHWTTGNIRPISFDLKAEEPSTGDVSNGLVQIDFSVSGIQKFRAVMDRAEFSSFVSALSAIQSQLPIQKLPSGELDPRD